MIFGKDTSRIEGPPALAVRSLWLARCSDPRGLGSALPLAMFKLLYRGKRGAERAEALLGPRRDDGPALFYRPFILTAWNDRLAGSLRFLPGCFRRATDHFAAPV